MKQCFCKRCQKEFYVFPSQRGDIYCSQECYDMVRMVKERPCQICAKVFKPNQKTKAGRFCSLKCYWKSMELPEEVLKLHSKENVRKYRREHPEWTAQMKQNRRSREAGAEGRWTKEEWKAVKERQKGLCAICGEEKKLTVDHIIPLSRGGTNWISNIQGLCGSCNSRKWAKT